MRLRYLTVFAQLTFICGLHSQTPVIDEASYTGKIRVACIGNGVTYGYGIENLETDSYPVKLQARLGDKYEVRNFGFNGATLLKNGHKPYWDQPPFRKALEFQPQIVVIHLGLNDTDPRNFSQYRKEFHADYLEMIQVFKNLNTDPETRVWICRMTPVFPWHKRFRTGTRDDFWAIQEAIEKVAKDANVTLIDLHTPLSSRPDLFEDAIHPSEEGTAIIASTVKSYLTGTFGGLSLPPVFSDHMVIQRNRPIRIYGRADAGKRIRVEFAGNESIVHAASDGTWQAEFAGLEAGGSYQLTVSADKTIQIRDILIGDVWLCSGQSNMAFPLSREKHGAEEIPHANHPRIRLFTFQAVAWPGGGEFSQEEMQKINRGEYFIEGPWQECTPETAADFSAVAYYFGKELQEQLDVPIGLIDNAVGGSNTESWISRKTLEFHPVFSGMFEDWLHNEQVQDWCRTRAAENLQNTANPNQLHPFAPAYLFETAIHPLEGYPFKGVIWYQGESNAEKIEQHEELFKIMVADWRKHFDNEELPFYYVQLSSLNRETWPAFRNSQRKLLMQIPKSGMVVTSDIGHPTNVHPTNKKDVGHRLALWAFHGTYGLDVVYSGPLYRSMEIKNKKIIICFDHAGSGLTTAGKEKVRGFEMAGEDGKYIPARVRIRNNHVILTGKKLSDPKQARYGWEPYTDANIVNMDGLPTSTFSTEKQSR